VYWPLDYKNERRRHTQGDFEIDRFTLDDMLITVYNPSFRPYTVSIFSADLPILRKQWLLYDIFCADSVVGMFDNCLFSVHQARKEEQGMAKSFGNISRMVRYSFQYDTFILFLKKSFSPFPSCS